MMYRYILTAIIVLSFAASGVAQDKSGGVAWEFSLLDVRGEQVRLSDYRGKVVLVNFWATWCTPCQEEMPRFMTFQRELGDKGFQAIGISMDDSERPVRSFVSKLKVNYPIAMGTAKVARSYGGVLGLPVSILINRSGHIVKRFDGAVDLEELERAIREQLGR
jgi:cytochrome c biogenesis protein CcmG/thiol:disulfide interchange protein DsbE